MMPTKSTVVIADNIEIVREGIAAKLEGCSRFEVAGLASDGFSTLKLCRNMNPDVLVLDMEITRPSGIETLIKVRKSCPNTKIVILSSENSMSKAFMALSKGAVAYMPKQSRGVDFVSAIYAAADGYAFLPSEFVDDIVQSRRNVTRTGNLFGLSPREMEVLLACAEGQSTKEIAEMLNISVRTVETHRNSIYRKTSCNCLDDLKEIATTICGEEDYATRAVA